MVVTASGEAAAAARRGGFALVIGVGRDRRADELRSCGADIVVADPKASRRHTEIRPAGNGFLLVDLQSTNGTRVNGAPASEHMLIDGDRIGIGATEFRFEAS